MEQKSIILELEEAKASFIQMINAFQQRGFPLYLIDMALSGIYAQLKEGAKAEIAMAQQMGEQNKPKEKSE